MLPVFLKSTAKKKKKKKGSGQVETDVFINHGQYLTNEMGDNAFMT